MRVVDYDLHWDEVRQKLVSKSEAYLAGIWPGVAAGHERDKAG